MAFHQHRTQLLAGYLAHHRAEKQRDKKRAFIAVLHETGADPAPRINNLYTAM